MRISDPSQLVVGDIIYIIRNRTSLTAHEVLAHSIYPSPGNAALGKKWMDLKQCLIHDSITALTATHLKMRSDGMWDYKYDEFYEDRIESLSMQDAGIIPNTYNDHQTFTSLAEAKLYGEGKLDITEIEEAPTAVVDPCDYDRAMKLVSW